MSGKRFYRLGVLGFPLGHTLSPALHTWMLARTGLEGFYVPLENEDGRAALKALAALGFHGVNVTVPHKITALKASVTQSETAKLIGAANTMVLRDGGWHAHNTDGEGLLMSLRESFGKRGPKEALLIGAGGAARGALWALAAWGVREVTVLNRTGNKAKALRPLAADLNVSLHTAPLEQRTTLSAPAVIQATTLGMSPKTGTVPTRMTFPRGCYVLDLIYRPRRTRFLQQAHEQGALVQDGLPMLAYQALAAFREWTGKRIAPAELMAHAATLLPPSG